MIFVVDDDASRRDVLPWFLRSVGLQITTFASAREFLQYRGADVPGCLVLDVRLPGLSGLDLQHELAAAQMDLPIIFITGYGDIPMTVRAMKGGAMEFLTKPFRTRRLLDAIRAAIERDRDTLKQRTEVAQLRNCYDLLTPREREVLAGVATGASNAAIAESLFLTKRAVEKNINSLFAKLDLTDDKTTSRRVRAALLFLADSDLEAGPEVGPEL